MTENNAYTPLKTAEGVDPRTPADMRSAALRNVDNLQLTGYTNASAGVRADKEAGVRADKEAGC